MKTRLGRKVQEVTFTFSTQLFIHFKCKVMPFTIVSQKSSDPVRAAQEIERKDIQELVDRNFKHTRKNKKDEPDEDYGKKMNKKEDTLACWFSMAEIEKVLMDNGYDWNASPEEKKKWGMRIYYGYHHKKNNFQPKCDDPALCEKLYHQHTSILVVTETRADGAGSVIQELDHLMPGHQVTLAASDTGIDNGKLCPPSCSGNLIS
jgi:hypothetical protein